jgi:MFS family permease
MFQTAMTPHQFPFFGPSKKTLDETSSPSTRSLRGLDWFTFFLGDIQTGFGPFLTVYLVTQKWTQTDIGLVLTLGGLASLLGQIPGGALIDAIKSERSAVAAAVAAIALSALLIAAWPIFAVVVLARVIHALASCVLGPAVGAITLGLVGHNTVARRLGRNACFASIGNGAAAILIGACGYFLSAQSVFYVTAAFAFPTLAALFQIREADISPERAHGGVANGSGTGILPGLKRLSRKRALWVFIGSVALFQMANAPMLPLVGSALTMRSGSWAVTIVAACVVLPQLLVAVFSPWVGKLAHSWGRRPLLLVGLCALPIRGLLFAYSTDPAAIVGVQMLDGVSAAVLGVLLPLVIADITRGTGRFNLAQGMAGMAIGIGASLSMYAAGYLTDHLGSRAAFLALSGTAGCALLLAMLMPETRPIEEAADSASEPADYKPSVGNQKVPLMPPMVVPLGSR